MIYTKELFSFILGKEDFEVESEEEEKIIIKQKGKKMGDESEEEEKIIIKQKGKKKIFVHMLDT